MYTIVKSVQIIISLLKEYKIRNLVLSPGSRNVPFVHSVENDPYFVCYSIVDERSAGFFALGLAEELNEPVLLSCTSSTAASNYFPSIVQAKMRGVQLIALTADRHPYFRGHLENQMIKQLDMYGEYCKKSVDLPVVYDKEDAEYCERIVNEALLELNHKGKGPVQINYPVYSCGNPPVANFMDYTVENLPKCRVIKRIEADSDISLWNQYTKRLSMYKKIMLIFGEGYGYSDDFYLELRKFFKRFNCMITVEHMSNIHCKGALNTFKVSESISNDELQEILPDLVITFGANFASDLKNKLRTNHSKFEHWRVAIDGDIVDPFMALTAVFECTDDLFLSNMIQYLPSQITNDQVFYHMWKKKLDAIVFPDLQFTNFYTIGEFSKKIPENATLHLSILNSIRLAQFFYLPKSVRVFANLGAYGIDGSLSTFLGNASVTLEPSFLIIGDLSFFYDMSSVLIKTVNKYLRILILNNHGGGEFHYVYHRAGFNRIDDHISAGHNSSVCSWASAVGVDYLCASNRNELAEMFEKFFNFNDDKPIILEVVTDMQRDADVLTEFYRKNMHFTKKSFLKKAYRKGMRHVRKFIK